MNLDGRARARVGERCFARFPTPSRFCLRHFPYPFRIAQSWPRVDARVQMLCVSVYSLVLVSRHKANGILCKAGESPELLRCRIRHLRAMYGEPDQKRDCKSTNVCVLIECSTVASRSRDRSSDTDGEGANGSSNLEMLDKRTRACCRPRTMGMGSKEMEVQEFWILRRGCLIAWQFTIVLIRHVSDWTSLCVIQTDLPLTASETTSDRG